MSNHCAGCRYDVSQAAGDDGCPFNALYWDFLARHERTLGHNARLGPQVRNLARKPPAELVQIRRRAADLRARLFQGARV
jgi:deoxyribodipyrimidine photolyase-related protein